MIKMVVSSFYNALIDEEESIPMSTMLEIERIRTKGILFSVCTNRFYKEILDYNKDFPFLDYIISLNGSYIYDVSKNRCLLKKKLSITSLKKIMEIFKNYNVIYYTEESSFKNISKIEDKEIFKVEVELVEEEEVILEKVKKINVNYSIFKKENKKYLEITSNKSNMFIGVDQIALKNNINLKDIVVIGANESEISLVKNIPNSYIMKNSPDSLKKITKKLTNSNSLKGVENILKKL